MQQIESSGAYWYNALLVSLNSGSATACSFKLPIRSQRGSLTDAFTTSGANGGQSYGNQDDPSSAMDRTISFAPHRLITNFTYQFPDQRFALVQRPDSGWLDAAGSVPSSLDTRSLSRITFCW